MRYPYCTFGQWSVHPLAVSLMFFFSGGFPSVEMDQELRNQLRGILCYYDSRPLPT